MPEGVHESLRSCVVAFMAADKSLNQDLAGTGFFIAAAPDLALGITAKHVLSEGVLNIQRPVAPHANSALAMFLPPSANSPISDPTRLRALWMGKKTALALNVPFAFYVDTLDLSCCVFVPQEGDAGFAPISIPMDTTVPNVGDLVHMVSQNSLNLEDTTSDSADKKTFEVVVSRALSVRCGIVTGVYPDGYRQYRWPCFTTSIPAEPGMSGGFVYIPRENEVTSACGVVCADNSSIEARSSFADCGESVIGCTWPALALRVPESFPYKVNDSTKTLYELMNLGRLALPVGGIDHIEIVSLENEECTLFRRT